MSDLERIQAKAARLRQARAKHYASATDAAKALDVPVATYTSHENGTREFYDDRAEFYARKLHVSVDWLLFGRGGPDGTFSVPLEGMIQSGQDITLFEDSESGQVTEASFPVEDTFACENWGESMYPLARKGDILFFARPHKDLNRLLDREVFVQLEDGKRMFKILRRGSRHGLYDLASHNADPIRDQQVHSAGLFLGVRRRTR
jgi:phage repressor protein C with HTH and peptisase S24 domain